jgi:hypothetical protein
MEDMAYPGGTIDDAAKTITQDSQNGRTAHLHNIHLLTNEAARLPFFLRDGIIGDLNIWDVNVQELYNNYDGIATRLQQGNSNMQHTDHAVASGFQPRTGLA